MSIVYSDRRQSDRVFKTSTKETLTKRGTSYNTYPSAEASACQGESKEGIMTRRSKNRQSHKNSADNQHRQPAQDLLQFHYRTPVREDHQPNQRSRKKHHNPQQYNRSSQDRASARRKAQTSMFYLHSSANHSFSLARNQTFRGCDQPVSWETVKVVNELLALSQEEHSCPICLSDFTCARITKCGHSFCFPCLLRHLHVAAETNPNHAAKCPCCGLPLLVHDLRPVTL